MKTLRALLLLLFACGSTFLPLAGAQDAAPTQSEVVGTSVGVPRWKRDLVIEGSEVEVAPANNATPMVLRIAEVYPHGSAFRYDIEYYGLEPGAFDLRDFLRRKDGTSLDDAAAIPVVIESSLPPDVLRPNALESGEVPAVGGYKTAMWVLGALWLVGLWAILTMGRKHALGDQAEEARPLTLADRLRPLVEAGVAGTLNAEESAQLELNLIAFWRRKLALQDMSSAEALLHLKQHGEAGPLLRQLELWLHSPGGGGDVDPAKLLAPYQGMAADEFEIPIASGAGAPA